MVHVLFFGKDTYVSAQLKHTACYVAPTSIDNINSLTTRDSHNLSVVAGLVQTISAARRCLVALAETL